MQINTSKSSLENIYDLIKFSYVANIPVGTVTYTSVSAYTPGTLNLNTGGSPDTDCDTSIAFTINPTNAYDADTNPNGDNPVSATMLYKRYDVSNMIGGDQTVTLDYDFTLDSLKTTIASNMNLVYDDASDITIDITYTDSTDATRDFTTITDVVSVQATYTLTIGAVSVLYASATATGNINLTVYPNPDNMPDNPDDGSGDDTTPPGDSTPPEDDSTPTT